MKIVGYFAREIRRFGSHLRLDRKQYNQQQCYALYPLSPGPKTYRCKVKLVTSPARSTCTATVSPGSNSPRRNM